VIPVQVIVHARKVSRVPTAPPALQGTMVFLGVNVATAIWLELMKHNVMLLRDIVGAIILDSVHAR
jgi:hypothetical protein